MNAIPQRCHDCLVREKALCSSMTDSELVAVSEIGRRRMVPAGHVVTWAGDASTTCANVVSGALKVTASTADGREQIVGLMFPGDFVGQLFTEEASLTVTTLTETDLCSFPRTKFERTLDSHPRLERMLLERTMSALNEARDRMLSLGRKNAQERIAGFLLELAERAGQADASGDVRVIIPISRGEMADYLGLTIETISRQLTRLKASGIIAFDKGGRECVILDSDWLEAIVNPS
jgi:CRP/FNR family transcriptional regulator, anaerobic regulatory protein